MVKKLPLAILAACACGYLCSCDKRPEGVLSEKDTVDLLVDMQLAQAYYSATPATSGRPIRKELLESVMKEHGVSQEQLDSTISYYGRNMDEYYHLYEKVEKKLLAKTGQIPTSAPANDIWPYNRFAAFFPGQMSNGLTFSIPADDLEAGDAVEWHTTLTSAVPVEMILGVEYSDGEATLVKRTMGGRRELELKVLTDTSKSLGRIFGVLSIPDNSLPIWADSIRLEKTEFDSLEYYKLRQQKLIRKPSMKPVAKTSADTTKGETTEQTVALERSIRVDQKGS